MYVCIYIELYTQFHAHICPWIWSFCYLGFLLENKDGFLIGGLVIVLLILYHLVIVPCFLINSDFSNNHFVCGTGPSTF